jgi:homoserine O-acetyltransferase/O-succinyltransferase
MRVEIEEPVAFTLALPELRLEAGACVRNHCVAGVLYGPREDAARLAQGLPLDPSFPTALLLHPLTARPGVVPDSFFGGIIGKGRPLRPWAIRVLSLNLLGSCFGTSGPRDPAFPKANDDIRFRQEGEPLVRGSLDFASATLPATVTPFDQAASVAEALRKLGLSGVRLALGGSLGGMVVQCLAWRYPELVHTAVSVAAPAASTAFMIGQNHVAREAILRDESYPSARTGLSVARQVARLSYRSACDLERSQGRRTAGPAHEGYGAWNPRMPYRIQTYLRHAGDSFASEFHAPSYVCLSLAMDHHDLARQPFASLGTRLQPQPRLFNLRIDTDGLVSAESQARLSTMFREQGMQVIDSTLKSPYGHDGFLVQNGAPLREVVLQALR